MEAGAGDGAPAGAAPALAPTCRLEDATDMDTDAPGLCEPCDAGGQGSSGVSGQGSNNVATRAHALAYLLSIVTK